MDRLSNLLHHMLSTAEDREALREHGRALAQSHFKDGGLLEVAALKQAYLQAIDDLISHAVSVGTLEDEKEGHDGFN